MKRLRAVMGLKGAAAQHAAMSLRDIQIDPKAARAVFEHSTIPREESTTAKVFPGSETLPADAFGGLVSLIYNRGPLIDKIDRRREMLQLFQLFRKGQPFDLKAIAALVEDQRAALLLVVLEGLTYREVAEVQGVPIGTVMSRLARARMQIKAYLDGERPALRRVK